MKYLTLVSLLATAAALPQYGQVAVTRRDAAREYSPKVVVRSDYIPYGKEDFHKNDKEFAKILRDDRIQGGDGSYSFHYESDDGISRSETGRLLEHVPYNPVASQGAVKFTFPTGEEFELKFIADENGYQPESSWLPVAPAFPHPIPQFVLDQIEKAAREDAEAARRQAEEHRQYLSRDSYGAATQKPSLEASYQVVREVVPKVTKQEHPYFASPNKQSEEIRQESSY